MRTPAPAGFGFFLGAALAVAATFLVVAAGARSQPVISVVALVGVVDLVALISTATATLATAAVCWCLHSGFVLGSLGELTFTTKSGHDALVLVGCALGGLLLASTLRASSAPLHEREYDPQVPTVPVPRRVQALTSKQVAVSPAPAPAPALACSGAKSTLGPSIGPNVLFAPKQAGGGAVTDKTSGQPRSR